MVITKIIPGKYTTQFKEFDTPRTMPDETTQDSSAIVEAIHRTWMEQNSGSTLSNKKETTKLVRTLLEQNSKSPINKRHTGSMSTMVDPTSVSDDENAHLGYNADRGKTNALPVYTTVSYKPYGANNKEASHINRNRHKIVPSRLSLNRTPAFHSDLTLQNGARLTYERRFQSAILTQEDDVPANSPTHVSPAEVIILLSFFILWFFAIGLFITKWRKFKLIEPRDVMQNKPKNLENVKIVQRSSDSIIYNSYPEAMTRNMALREKRLQRMRTLPAIKVNPEQRSPAHVLKRDLNLPFTGTPMLVVHTNDSRLDEEDVRLQQLSTEKYPMLLKSHDGLSPV